MNKYITQNPAILGGKPIVAGTRMSVESILELLASDMEIKDIIKEYPFLKKEYIQAAIDYAAKLTGNKKAYTATRIPSENFQAIPHEISGRR